MQFTGQQQSPTGTRRPGCAIAADARQDRRAARAGWDLTAERVGKSPDGLDIPALLDRIEAEMADPQASDRIGERLGLYRDWPVSKGCTSPFAPIWITTMVSRQT